jgi:hypothetical protein
LAEDENNHAGSSNESVFDERSAEECFIQAGCGSRCGSFGSGKVVIREEGTSQRASVIICAICRQLKPSGGTRAEVKEETRKVHVTRNMETRCKARVSLKLG